MRFLERHIADTVREWQMKIGYQRETMKLYYPRESLADLLELEDSVSEEELMCKLRVFCEEMSACMGQISISDDGERYCIAIPPEGCAYIYEHTEEPEFLRNFLAVLTRPGSSMEDVRHCFADFAKAHSMDYREESGETGMSHVFYFAKPEPDPYIYCVESDDFGLTYHRFTHREYAQMRGRE